MKNKLLTIINHYGINNQQRKLQEEVFELQESITNLEYEYRICNENDEIVVAEKENIFKEHIEEEIADVCVLLMQICNYYKLSVRNITKVMEMKLDRQLERIKNE